MEGKQVISMLSMLTMMTNEEELVEKCISSLQEYKLTGFKKENMPVSHLMMLMMKMRFKDMSTTEIMQEIMKAEKDFSMFESIMKPDLN